MSALDYAINQHRHVGGDSGTAGFSMTSFDDDSPVEADWLSQSEEQFQRISELPSGWDSYGSSAPEPHLIEAGFHLLMSLATADPRLPRPHINPTRSGGVQFEWENGNRYFEIEVITAGTAGFLFEDIDSQESVEGEIPLNQAGVRYLLRCLSHIA